MQIDPKNIPNNISISALKILSHLADAGATPVNVTDIATFTGIHNVSASEFLFKFESKGLVIRHAHPTDRRQSLFTLSQKGESLIHAWQPDALSSSSTPELLNA